jgi:recombination DNA repair RAD52 pathway protein
MGDVNGLVTDIEKKVKQLITLQSILLDQNLQLNAKNKELSDKIKEQNKIIEQLKDKDNYIKIAQSVKQSEGNTDVKKKIDELVREIDKCIGLLNK